MNFFSNNQFYFSSLSGPRFSCVMFNGYSCFSWLLRYYGHIGLFIKAISSLYFKQSGIVQLFKSQGDLLYFKIRYRKEIQFFKM